VDHGLAAETAAAKLRERFACFDEHRVERVDPGEAGD
jgi:hypothetical protein